MPNAFLTDNLIRYRSEGKLFDFPLVTQSPRVPKKDSGVSPYYVSHSQSRSNSSFRRKIRVPSYILSEPNCQSQAPQSCQFSGKNLNLSFNTDSPTFLLALILLLSNAQFSYILLPFCYPIGEKNLTRRLQNGRLGMSAQVGACGCSSVHSEDLGLPEAKPQVRRGRYDQ